jgi:hypothetical protein
MLADRAALDRRAGNEQARAGAVVGALAAILLDAPAELRKRHQHDALAVIVGFEFVEEMADRLPDFG